MGRLYKDENAIATVGRKRRPVKRSVHPGSSAKHAAAPDIAIPTPPRFPDRVFDIRNYGAAEGADDCASAIAQAIRACHEARGGRVLIPPGRWMTGAIHLKSNVELHLAAGAVVSFHADPQKYLPAVFVRWAGMECFNYSPFIYARDCENIAVTGKGTLLGQGSAWWDWCSREADTLDELYHLCRQGVPADQRMFGAVTRPLRPQMIQPINCTNVLMDGFTIAEGGAHWILHLAYCQNVTVRNVRIHAPLGPNNDGIVIDSSRNVLVENCQLHTREDCVSLKSGLNDDGWRVGRPTENVVVRGIRATHGHGGFSIGSDMSGDIRNVLVQNCDFDATRVGIRMKAARGRGGVVEDVRVRDIRLDNILEDAIQLTTEYPSFARADGKAPTFRNISVGNLACGRARCAGKLAGTHDAVLQRILLENITINSDTGLQCEAVSHLRLSNLRIVRRSGPMVSLRDGQHVVIEGVHPGDEPGVFLDLRGRQTRDIRLSGDSTGASRPAILLGIDVPHDALVHE